jgi:hypothetical protein
VIFQVAARTSSSTRSTTLTIAGRTVTLTQTGASATLGAPSNLRIIR